MFHRSTIVVLGLAAILTTGIAGDGQGGHYTITDVGPFDGGLGSASGINNSGQVVGYADYLDPAGFYTTRSFLYNGGTLTDVGTLGGGRTYTFGINQGGQVVGCAITSSGEYHSFVYSNGTMQDLGTLGAWESSAYAINNSGQIAGTNMDINFNCGAFRKQPNSTTIENLGTLGGSSSSASALNDSGQVVGEADTSSGAKHAFLYSGNGPMQDLGTLGGSISWASSINNSGQVVGGAYTSGDFASHAFLYSGNGTMTDLGALGGRYSEALGINAAGQVVGDVETGNGYAAFLYSNGTMQNLNALISARSGWNLQGASGINDLGQIAGNGLGPSGHAHVFLLTPAIPGDANLDGLVDILDLNRLLTSYNHTATTWADGDFDENATIDATDLNKLLTIYNHSTASAGPHSVPEPSTVVLAIAAAITLFGVSRHRCD